MKKLIVTLRSYLFMLSQFKRELNNAQHSPRGDEFAGLISTLVKNLAKSAMLLDKTNLGSMSLKEISMEADKLDKFPNETSRVRKFEGIPYELMTTKLGDYKQFAVDSQGGAASLCASSNRTLLMAKSKKVNDFIWNWLSGELHLESRVWLGLAANGTKEKFIWFDGEDATKGYSNWLECDSNSNGNGMLCAQLVVHDSEVRGGMDYDKTCNAKAGQWVASPCKYYDMYLVICQG